MKKVVFKIPNNEYVDVESVDSSNIYILKSGHDIYKAHGISNNTWSFVGLFGSEYCANGDHDSLKKLLKSNIDRACEVYEFYTYVEFIKWAKDNF